jgi:hypothetical protein
MGTPEDTSFGVLFARLTWALLGPLALVLLTFAIASAGGGWLTAADVAYLAVLAAMLAGRWLEFRSGQGRTAEGEPMTGGDLRRYLLLATALGLAVWVGANLLGNHWLAGG